MAASSTAHLSPQGCGESCLQAGLESQRESTCPGEKLSCEFSSFGCEEMLTKANKEKHEKDSISNHHSLMSSDISNHLEKKEKNCSNKSCQELLSGSQSHESTEATSR